MLQRNGMLPTVRIPPGALRDQRELPRTRMVLVRQRTQLKNRLHATLAKYAFHDVQRKPHPRQRHEQLNG
jgi:transposase